MSDLSPLFAQDAERSVIGAIFLDNRALTDVADLLDTPDFHDAACRVVYGAMLGLTEAGQPIDVVTVAEALRSDLASIGGPSTLAMLDACVPSSGNVRHYAQIVASASRRRRIQALGKALALHANNPDRDVDDLVDDASAQITALAEVRGQQAARPMKDMMRDAYSVIESRYYRKDAITGLRTGLPDFDGMTSGLQPGQLIVIAGRPSMGKSALALNIAEYAALNGAPTMFFSMEMSELEVIERLLAQKSGVDLRLIRNGQITDPQWGKLHKATEELKGAQLCINDRAANTLSYMRLQAQRFKTKAKSLGLIVVDYLQLARAAGKRGGSREEEVSEISRGLKQLGKDLGCPVAALSQLNRSVEKRENKRPMMSDLRESGSIEQDADVIAFLYREEVYKKQETAADRKGKAELILSKQRSGPIGTVQLRWGATETRFSHLAAEEYYKYKEGEMT